jgi:hypothetical protein
MWLVAIILFIAVTFLLLITKNHASESDETLSVSGRRTGDRTDASVIPNRTVQLSIATGAPPTPWIPSREDRQAMAKLERFFARAIPNPTKDGRPYVDEKLGHGGPQLELYVPIVSTHRPVAILARNWDPAIKALVANLFFSGAVQGRLGEIVRELGFEAATGTIDPDITVYRNRRGFIHQRSG